MMVRIKSQCNNRLWSALNIYGFSFVVVILWTSICFKKMKFEIRISTLKLWLEFPITGAIHIALQAVQIVTCMKVVDPMVWQRICIIPSAVGILPRAAINHGISCQIESLAIISVTGDPPQQRCAQHVRVVNRELLERDIAEASSLVRLFPW